MLEAFPALEACLPWLHFGRYPTPVEPLEALARRYPGASVWVKRDDLTGLAYGGNKVRKLELLIADARARGATRLLTVGASGSHHVLATAWYGRQAGLRVDAVLYPQPMTARSTRNLEAIRRLCGEVSLVDRVSAIPGLLATLDPRRMERTAYVPAGGTSALGNVGYVSAAIELRRQIDAGGMPVPERVYVALGSGGTAAGLALGLAIVGLPSCVVGVRIAPRAVANEALWRLQIAQTRALLKSLDRNIPVDRPVRIEVEGRFLGRGYGHSTEAGDGAVRSAADDGLELEGTYTGKAFAALCADLEANRRGPLLFWNTVSSRPFEALGKDSPATHADEDGRRHI